MKRTNRKMTFNKKSWQICALVPADFLECSYWPFSFYRMPEDSASQSEVKRDWKLKPKNQTLPEDKLAASVRQALRLGAGVINDIDFEKIKKNEMLYNLLLTEIYAASYELSTVEKYFNPQKIISRDFAEALALKSKALHVEPFSFLTNLVHEKPELHNPRRYDFNWFILGIGWEKERREIEKAQANAKAKYNVVKK
jgi:hypothetical protein